MAGLLLEGAAPVGDNSSQYAGDLTLATYPQQQQLVPVEARLEALRRDREVHSYKQIWTKDPHDGPYRKAAVKTYDPLLQLPDGTKREVELGYERVECGPTTNFVGNHMTQGAIDLVQAELEKPVADLLMLPGPASEPYGPRLLDCRPAERGAGAGQRPGTAPLREYSWWDGGAVVCIRLDMARCRKQLQELATGLQEPQERAGQGAALGALALECSWARHSLQLRLSCQQPSACSPPESDGALAPPPSVQLLLDPLCSAIQPDKCCAEVVGPAALPAAASASSDASISEAVVGATAGAPASKGDCPSSIAGEGASAPPAAEAEAAPKDGPAGEDSRCSTRSMCLVVGPTAAAVVVRLHKGEPTTEWASLQGTLAVVQPQQQPDLVALRRLVRRQRQAAPDSGNAAAGDAPGELLHNSQAPESQGTLAPAGAAAGAQAAGVSLSCPAGVPTTPPPAWQDLVAAAQQSAQAGQHQAAIDACTAALQQWAPHALLAPRTPQPAGALQVAAGGPLLVVGVEPRGPSEEPGAGGVAEALALRAECLCHVGALKQAAVDYTAALDLCCGQPAAAAPASGGSIGGTAGTAKRLLLSRASVYEQLEQYGQALEDLRRVAAWQHPAVEPQVSLGIQRVSRSLRELEMVQERQRSEGGVGAAQPPSVKREPRYFIKPKVLRI